MPLPPIVSLQPYVINKLLHGTGGEQPLAPALDDHGLPIYQGGDAVPVHHHLDGFGIRAKGYADLMALRELELYATDCRAIGLIPKGLGDPAKPKAVVGLAGLAATMAVLAVGDARARRRDAGTTLGFHIRYPWVSSIAVGDRFTFGGKHHRAFISLSVENSGATAGLVITYYLFTRDADAAHRVGRELARRISTDRLGAGHLDDDRRRRLQAIDVRSLKSGTPLRIDGALRRGPNLGGFEGTSSRLSRPAGK